MHRENGMKRARTWAHNVTLWWGFGVCALLLAGCTNTTPAPIVQGGIKQNWLGQDNQANQANQGQMGETGPIATAPNALPALSQNASTVMAYQQPIAPLLQEEELPSLEPAAGPFNPSSAATQPATVAPAVAARPAAFAATPSPTPAPEVTTYTIKPQDTLFKVARAHNTTPNAIMQANGLSDIADITPGRTLTIPANTNTATPSLAESIRSYLETPATPQLVATAAGAPAQAQAAVYDVARIEPAAGQGAIPPAALKTAMHRHPVMAGETIYRISKAYGVSVFDIMAANDLAKPEALQAGMVLNIPAIASAETAATERAKAEAPARQPALQTAQQSVLLRPAADLGVTETTRATIAAQRALQQEPSGTRSFDPDKGTDSADSMRPLKAAKPLQDADRLKAEIKRGTIDRAAAAQSGMVWPAQGNVVKKFGEKGQGVAYTGINIALPVGTPVLASEAGTVLYADSGLRMYGQMVLIRHTNGMVAAYAHNSHLLVRKGEKVKKGQVIAMSGQSGNASSPQLHFELRRNAVALDPLKVLPQL
jgi:murein DD-endopeptidase MepM/ murein hydrolase activator NlpD